MNSQEEQRKEAEFNKLSEAVISKTPWGKFYGLMRGASRLFTQNLKQSVGIDDDGRPIVVYKKDISKILGTFAVPAHEWMAKEYAKKDWGGLLASVFTGGVSSEMKNIKQQKKAKFFDISPKEVEEIYNRRKAEEKAKLDNLTNLANLNKEKEKAKNISKISKSKILGMPMVAIGLGVAVLAVGGLLAYKYFKGKK
jgi:hypothetical protein